MRRPSLLLLLAALAAAAASAHASSGRHYVGDALLVDLAAEPIKDQRQSSTATDLGYAGCLTEGYGDCAWFYDPAHADATWKLFEEAGARVFKQWDSVMTWQRGLHESKAGNPNPKWCFDFWKKHGVKVLLTLEHHGVFEDAACTRKTADLETVKRTILDYVRWIVKNGYQDVVGGFELGNEPYWGSDPEGYAARWVAIVPGIKEIFPEAKICIPLAEYRPNDPDIAAVRARATGLEWVQGGGEFSFSKLNQWSGRFIVAMKPVLDDITHVIYHFYGAETPYSCSYHGFQRFRNFVQAFPELKDKKMWLSEVRPRSDEDNYCQRIFREALVMAHYSLMAICQPEMDGFNHHQIYALSGGIYQSDGRNWRIQWRDTGPEYADWRAPMGEPRLEVGACGVMYRILAEAIKEHPLILRHGTSKEADTEDAFFTSARVMDQVYARRRALKEGRTGRKVPKVEGEVEWVALADARREELCLLMVNTKSEPATVTLTARGKDRGADVGKEFASPTYRTLSCPEKFLDCRAVPGDGHPWTQLSWEDTQSGYAVISMAPNEGLKPAASSLTVEIAPHTVQSVTVRLRNAPEK